MIEQVAFPLAMAGAKTGITGIVIALLLLACLFLILVLGGRPQRQQE
jgi:xanthine/uracil/vitamin C permease (AzgA family)